MPTILLFGEKPNPWHNLLSRLIAAMRSPLPALKKYPWTQLIVILCLGLGATLRLWNFSNTLQFLGDQGRDAIIAKQIIINHHFPLLGPVTSAGNMYLGPLYYYFMAPFLAMSYPSPLGPAYAVAILSVITVALVFFLGKELVGETAAVIATILVAFSSTLVYFAHFSWNPNPSPFLAIILIWATYRAITKRASYWLIVSACLAVLLQLHYITLLCIPAGGILWLNQLRLAVMAVRKKATLQYRTELRQLLLAAIGAVLIFLLSLTPLVLFDIRHQFMNSQSFIHFVTADLGPSQTNIADKARLILTRTYLRTNQIFFEEFMWPNLLGASLGIAGLAGTLLMIWRQHQKISVGIKVILTYVIIGILGLGYYQGPIYNHYFVYLLPLVMLLWGVVLAYLLKFKWGWTVIAAFAVLYVIGNIPNYSLANRGLTITQIQQTSQTILNHLQPNEKYNIVLLSYDGDTYGENYRYFLETTTHPPLNPDQVSEINTLVVINEDHLLKNVLSSSIYEIVVFPHKQPTEVYNIPNGPEITVLRR